MSAKQSLQGAATYFGYYERLKESRLYDWYWSLVNPALIRARRAELAFYSELLKDVPGRDIVFDVGANRGTKTSIFLRLGASVIAVEPDVTNQQRLRRRFIDHRLRRLPVTIVGKALSDTAGLEAMWVDAPGSAKNTLSKKWVSTLRHDPERFGAQLTFENQTMVSTSTLDELILVHGRPKLIKIDVEGLEPRVLSGLSRAVPRISFEVNLPEFRDEGAECIGRLRSLDPKGVFNYATDCRDGFLLGSWVTAEECLVALAACPERSIEIFWKSAGGR